MIEDTKPRSGNVKYPAFIEKIASFLLSEPIASAHETTTSSSDARSETGTYSSDTSSEADSNKDNQSSPDSNSEKSTHLENDQESMAPTTQTQEDLDSTTQTKEQLNQVVKRYYPGRGPADIGALTYKISIDKDVEYDYFMHFAHYPFFKGNIIFRIGTTTCL